MSLDKSKVKSSMKAFESLDLILGNVATNKDVPKDATPRRGVDLKNVVVPESLIENVINFSKNIPEKKKEVVEEIVEVEEEVINEAQIVNRVSVLVSKLSSLLQEAKSVIAEMTTAGMIGTNQKFVLGKKGKKNGPIKVNKRNKS
jgi:hypothetical protein